MCWCVCSYVIAITLAPLMQSLLENQMQYMLNVAGLKMRNGLMAAIYRKCLRLSNAALQSESTGRVVTLMSNDAQKVRQDLNQSLIPHTYQLHEACPNSCRTSRPCRDAGLLACVS